jgi:integrase/recombinase XerD
MCSINSLPMLSHADLRLKEEALSKVRLLDAPPGRFRPDGELLAFREGRGLCRLRP